MPYDSPGLVPREVESSQEPFDPWDLAERIAETVKRSHRYFLQNQHPDGYWWFELESNVTITAEYLMLLVFAGIEDKARSAKIATHILKQQRPDGTWAIYKGGKADISTTVEAYFALKLAGYPPDDSRLEKARRFILANGGPAKTRFFTRIFLAAFGQYEWKAIPSVPVEIMLLPRWVPLNIYNFSSWARATFVPLSVILDAKPVKTIPVDRGVRELFGRDPADDSPIEEEPALSWKRFFAHLDRLTKAIEGSRLRVFRKRGLEAALRWINDHQEESGDCGGIQPAMVNSTLALLVQGCPLSSAPVLKGLEALERYTIERDGELRLQSCISPVWDTALTALALHYSGLKQSSRPLARACQWLMSQQILKKGDWSVKRPRLEPGGWAFEFVNSWYPDVDDTAVVLMFLHNYGSEGLVERGNLERAIGWLLGMQGKDGGWGAFDADNNTDVLNQIPFGDLEAMIDPSTPDITGRVLELLGQIKYPASTKAVRKALKFLRKTQDEDGLWWGRWGVNYVYGTWSVLAGLASIGEDMTRAYVRKAVETLKQYQNSDGGWGESCESYANKHLKMRGMSTPSQTAWAVMALVAAGEGACEPAIDGIRFLLSRQGPDGTWVEEEFTGTGFPKHFMIKYHNYRNCFPLMALGKFLINLKRTGLLAGSPRGE